MRRGDRCHHGKHKKLIATEGTKQDMYVYTRMSMSINNSTMQQSETAKSQLQCGRAHKHILTAGLCN